MQAFKTPQDAIKTYSKMTKGTVLPILTYGYVSGDTLTISNLADDVTIKHGWAIQEQPYLIDLEQVATMNSNEKVVSITETHAITSLGRKVLITTGDGVGDYPVSKLSKLDDNQQLLTIDLGGITATDAATINAMFKNVTSKDELRQAMMQVVIDEGKLVGTDAHKLFVRKIAGDLQGRYIPFKPVPKMANPYFGGQVQLLVVHTNPATVKEQKDRERYEKDIKELQEKKNVNDFIYVGHSQPTFYVRVTDPDGDLTITTRACGQKYPDYGAVRPQDDDAQIVCQFKPNELIEQIKLLLPSANKTTHAIIWDFCKNKVRAHDIDFSTEMEVDMLPGFAKPAVKLDAFKIGVNGKFLLELLDYYKKFDSVYLRLTSESRPICINGSLIMPLMVTNDD